MTKAAFCSKLYIQLMGDHKVNRPLQVSQPGQRSFLQLETRHLNGG